MTSISAGPTQASHKIRVRMRAYGCLHAGASQLSAVDTVDMLAGNLREAHKLHSSLSGSVETRSVLSAVLTAGFV